MTAVVRAILIGLELRSRLCFIRRFILSPHSSRDVISVSIYKRACETIAGAEWTLQKIANFGTSRALARMAQDKIADHPTILVAEDDGLLRLMASELLEDHGYTVVEADSAEEAIKVMEQRKDVRLLFTDIQMPPGCDGLELVREVHNRWPKVRLVITSGQVQPARAEIADHGRFIRKPYRAKDLLDQIDELIENKENTELQI
jgi:CheY-like chemotaxis protein